MLQQKMVRIPLILFILIPNIPRSAESIQEESFGNTSRQTRAKYLRSRETGGTEAFSESQLPLN